MQRSGFTLIELSVVLVIIGLIVGGVIVGQDMIRSAEIRSQISQIEKYNAATQTFRAKYGGLPGDLRYSSANSAGLWVGTYCLGQVAGRDGNGMIDGDKIYTTFPNPYEWTVNQGLGETALFWSDLSAANLVDGSWPNGANLNPVCAPESGNSDGYVVDVKVPNMGQLFPPAKIGSGNSVYVFDGSDGYNYFGISHVTEVDTSGHVTSDANIPVNVASSIDQKIDDGYPQSGKVMARYVLCCDDSQTGSFLWWAKGGLSGSGGALGDHDSSGGAVVTGDGVSTAPSSTTCYDNNSISGGTEQYSLSVNGGSGTNCAIAVQFQ